MENQAGFEDDLDDSMAGALIISCGSLSSEDLVKMIIQSSHLPEAVAYHDLVKAYPWSVQTKYYTANVYLFVTEEKNLISQTFAEGVQAVVIHYDATKKSSYEKMMAWQTFIEHFAPEVQILTCHNFTNIPKEDEHVLSKGKVLDWCLKNQYELVELYPEELNEDEEDEDDFKETTGIKRIIQALHAVMWPNMDLKENPTIKASERLEQYLKTQDENLAKELQDLNIQSSSDLESSNSTEAGVNIDMLLDEDKAVFEALELEGVESFENLFGRFHDMKEKAKTLQGEARKEYAEKVAIAFWKAMGGDEDEIDGLND